MCHSFCGDDASNGRIVLHGYLALDDRGCLDHDVLDDGVHDAIGDLDRVT